MEKFREIIKTKEEENKRGRARSVKTAKLSIKTDKTDKSHNSI